MDRTKRSREAETNKWKRKDNEEKKVRTERKRDSVVAKIERKSKGKEKRGGKGKAEEKDRKGR